MKRLKDLPEHYRDILSKKTNSTQNVKDFCSAHGISVWIYYYWRRRFKDKKESVSDNSTPLPQPSFIPVKMMKSQSPVSQNQSYDFELEICGSTTLRIARDFDKDSLRSLLGVLEHSS